MGIILNLILFKFIESLILVYANLRQKAVLERINRVPIDLSFAFSISDLNIAKTKLFRKINHDTLLVLWDLILFMGACCNSDLLRPLWNAAEDPDTYKDDPSFQPCIFAITCTLLYWFFRGHMATALQQFVNHGQPFTRQVLYRWWKDSLIGNCALLTEAVLQTLLVQMCLNYYGPSTAKFALASASFVYHLGSFLFLGPALHEPDDRPFVDLPEGRLKARLLSLAAVFNLSPSQVLFADSYDWRMYFEDEQESHGQTMRLVTTFYLEESGGGHAKTYEIPEILAYAAHSISFYKNFFPLVFSMLHSIETASLIIFAFYLARINLIYEEFGFIEKKPFFIGIFISYCFILPFINKVYRVFNNYVCRRFYRAGDRLVATLSNGRHLARVLGKLDSINTIFPVSDPLYTTIYSTKPPLAQRIRFLNSIMMFNNNNMNN